jgi:preprotein translocase subunit YajC
MVLMKSFVLIADDPAPAAPAGAGRGGEAPFWANPIFMIALFGLFFLVVMLPAQRRQKREQQLMLANIKPGVRILLNSGILGKVVKVKEGEDEITIQSEDSKLRVLRSTVVRVLGDETPETKPA